jgi:hypothetical protein
MYFNLNKAKLKNLTAIQEVQHKLSDIEANTLMNKPIEELLNKWKNELDTEVKTFDLTGQKLNNFEKVLHQNFDTVIINYIDYSPC